MRKILIAALGIALVGVGILFALVRPRSCPVNRTAFDQIKEGMVQAEVHAILGGPPGDYRTRPPATRFRMKFGFGPPRLIEEWEGDEGTVTVDYNPAPTGSETVMLADFKEEEPYVPGLVDLIRWRLEKLKNRWFP